MELRVKEETGHQESRPGAPVAAGPRHLQSLAPRRGHATCRAGARSGLFERHLGKIVFPPSWDVFLPFKRVVNVKTDCV